MKRVEQIKQYDRIQNRENKIEENVDLKLFFAETTAENEFLLIVQNYTKWKTFY